MYKNNHFLQLTQHDDIEEQICRLVHNHVFSFKNNARALADSNKSLQDVLDESTLLHKKSLTIVFIISPVTDFLFSAHEAGQEQVALFDEVVRLIC